MENELFECSHATTGRRVSSISIDRVSDGFIIGGCGVDFQFAYTLSGALVLVRKVFGN